MNGTADIQKRLDRSRVQLLEALEQLPDEALLEPNTVGRLSVADILAHLTAWEAELVTALMRIKQGKRPEKFLNALKDPSVYSKKRFEENRGRDLDLIFDDFQGVRVQLETWLEDFTSKELREPSRYKWLNGKSLAQIIAETTYEKESKYLPALKTFSQSWNASDDEMADLDESGVGQSD